MRRWRIQGTVFTSGIAYEYSYSQHFEDKSINSKPISALCLCHSTDTVICRQYASLTIKHKYYSYA